MQLRGPREGFDGVDVVPELEVRVPLGDEHLAHARHLLARAAYLGVALRIDIRAAAVAVHFDRTIRDIHAFVVGANRIFITAQIHLNARQHLVKIETGTVGVNGLATGFQRFIRMTAAVLGGA